MTGSSFVISHTEILEIVEECVHQCPLPAIFSWSGMCVDPRIFIDDSEVIILVDDIKWHVLSDELHIFDFPCYFYHITSIYFLIFREALAICSDLPFLDHLLEIASWLFGKKSRQVGVDSSGFSWVREDTEERDGIVIGWAHYWRNFMT